MLRKSCGRTACHKRCPTHPPLPASSHPPGPSPASTATRRRPPDSDPPSHRSCHAALPMRRRSAKPVRDCQDLSPPQPTLPSACGAARSYRRETLPSSAGRCRTDDHKTARPRLPKSVQPWQNCPEPVRLDSASLQFSMRSNENLLVVATEDRAQSGRAYDRSCCLGVSRRASINDMARFSLAWVTAGKMEAPGFRRISANGESPYIRSAGGRQRAPRGGQHVAFLWTLLRWPINPK